LQPTGFVSRDEICPLDRVFHTPKTFLQPNTYTSTNSTDVEVPLLNELSAMAVSAQRVFVLGDGDDEAMQDHVLAWVCSDGEQSALSAVDLSTGATVAVLHLEGVTLVGSDWEAIALGPCTSTSSPDSRECLYIGNVGNNGAHECKSTSCTSGRDTLFIYKLEEPEFTSLQMGDIYRPVATLPINFYSPDFPVNRYNIEAMFLDWTGIRSGSSSDDGDQQGDIYLIPKHKNDESMIRTVKIPVKVHESLVVGSTDIPAQVYTCQAPPAPSWDATNVPMRK
jgi:hypothetical protein